jgi:hypothetical protein
VARVDEKMDQIAGILTRNEIPFVQNSDGSEYRVLYESTGVFISVRPFRDGTVVHLEAPVVVELDLNDKGGGAFWEANQLNSKAYFGKFTVHSQDGRGTLCVELDVLGDDLQASELTNALMIVAELADENDDRLEAEIGGKTYAEVLNASLTADDETIIAALRKLVGDGIDAGTAVVLEAASPPDCNYYVQFATQDGVLFCEAVSNEYLESPCQLNHRQLRTLKKLGWGPPEVKGQNWFRTFQPTSSQDYEEIVRLAHRAFRDVYHVPEDAPITMQTSFGDQTP